MSGQQLVPIAIGDTVAFSYYGSECEGVVVRLSPTRAVLHFATKTDLRQDIARDRTIPRRRIHRLVKRAAVNQ